MTEIPPKNNQAKAFLVRQQILEAARILYRDKDGQEVSVRDIAARAGYSTGAVYFHFKNKEAIYAELLIQGLTDLSTQVKQASEAKSDAFSSLMAGYLSFYRFYDENPGDLIDILSRIHSPLMKQRDEPVRVAINEHFRQIKWCFRENLVRFGVSDRQAEQEAAVLISDIIGLLLSSARKTDILFSMPSDDLLNTHLERLQKRIQHIIHTP
ncbi:TetR/AcrR family transcriptional regulator [Sneathiella aquimaris]|uniref:TetR/AcrR family transcriptional regulator n=1 Tax=Sneathiella aquimaris TaxID=2599305 RepID=UPI00146D1809|nr:TetR/AcrR family transcriptional regulator [Sneathiella aquimaris]